MIDIDNKKTSSVKGTNQLVQECYTETICKFSGICQGSGGDAGPVITVNRAVNGSCHVPEPYHGCQFFNGWTFDGSESHQICHWVEYPDPVIPGFPPPIHPGIPGNPNPNPGIPNTVPCPGDPIKTATIAPSRHGNINGGRFGNARIRNGIPRWHYGTDIYAELNTPLYPIMSGTVVGIVNNVPQGLLGYSEGGFGNLIIVESTLENGEKIQVLYAHLNEVNSNLHYGSAVTQGSSMGLSGNTGNAFKGYKPHIHIQISINGQKIDAEPYIRTKFTANGSPIITPC